jgi:hypothetical protein
VRVATETDDQPLHRAQGRVRIAPLVGRVPRPLDGPRRRFGLIAETDMIGDSTTALRA